MTQAQNASVPAIPVAISSHATLVGKIIVARNAGTATSIQSAFDTNFSYTSITSHPDLTNLGWTVSGHTGTINTIAGFD